MLSTPFKLVLCALTILLWVQTGNASNNEVVAARLQHLMKTEDAEIKTALGSAFDQVKVFYATRNFKPIWTRDDGPKSKGKALLQELKRSKLHGLSPTFYGTKTLDGLINASSPEELAKLDLLLSAAFIDYSADLKNGHINPANGFAQNQVKPILTTADALVKGAAEAGNFRNLAKLFLTTDERYFRLIAKFLELVRIERTGNWPKISADGKAIGAGKSDPRIKDIRVLLALSQDLPADKMQGDNKLDLPMVKAVKHYQQRHGFTPTGDIDSTTLASMAVPVRQLMNQILVNLERRRWQNRDLGDDHLYVNLADGMGRLVLAGKTVGFFDIDASTHLPAFYGKITGFKRARQKPGQAQLIFTADEPATNAVAGEIFTMKVPDSWKPNAMLGSIVSQDAKAFGDIALQRPLRLYVTYLTTWSDKAGTLHVRKDVANRDAPLVESLLLAK